eukprot:Opistho-2@14862
MIERVLAVLLLATLAWSGGVSSYKPVLLMHGIDDNCGSLETLAGYIREAHPGTLAIPLPLFQDRPDSWLALWFQAEVVSAYISTLTANNASFAEGYHLVCHSQGALLCRAVLQLSDDHKCDTFVSLAGPLMGEYGPYDFLQNYYPNITVPNLWRLLYTDVLQDTVSAANLWHDPFPEHGYLTKNKFLPAINNEVEGKYDARYRTNFARLRKLALFISPADESIFPWQSAIFGFYDSSGSNVVEMRDQDVYLKDLFGLKTLDADGRILQVVLDNKGHEDWIYDRELFTYYEPLLV